MARPDTEVVFDPATYASAVPFDALARLRRDHPVVDRRGLGSHPRERLRMQGN